MKKVVAFLLAVVIFIATVTLVGTHYDVELQKMQKDLYYATGVQKDNCVQGIGKALNENTILLLGSSELPYYDEKSHPKIITNNGNSNFNIMEVGVGYNQSLMHAINAGGLAPYIQNKKIVLNLSPQWFTKEHLQQDAFSSRFSNRMFAAFMENPKISKNTKEKVTERCEKLFSDYEPGQEIIRSYKTAYLGKDVLKRAALQVSGVLYDMQAEKTLLELLGQNAAEEISAPDVDFENIDFNELMDTAEKQGQTECTNNSFYIYDSYYDQYVRQNLKEQKDRAKNLSYCDSPEYEDLRLFLEVCQENSLEVMLISIPVNGYWYDYTGFPKKDRKQYYQNIRDIAQEYDVELLDLSSHEYTPYFLKDIMHLGWKGWVYLDEGIYNFYKKGN